MVHKRVAGVSKTASTSGKNSCLFRVPKAEKVNQQLFLPEEAVLLTPATLL